MIESIRLSYSDRLKIHRNRLLLETKMGNGVSKKRNCEICNEKIYDKSGKEIVVIDHANHCREKTNNKNNINGLQSEISDLHSRLFVSNEAKTRAENLVALYKRTYSTEVPKLQEQHRIKDSKIERLEKMVGENSMRIKNQSANLNGIQKRHQESLQKNKELGNKVSHLQRQGLITIIRTTEIARNLLINGI